MIDVPLSPHLPCVLPRLAAHDRALPQRHGGERAHRPVRDSRVPEHRRAADDRWRRGLLQLLGISTLYAPLLSIKVIGAGLQVVLLGSINVLFYLDRRRLALLLVSVFLVANGLLTAITLWVGPEFFGYGYAGALLIVCVLGLLVLDRVSERLEYETFMLQPGA